MRGLFLVWFLFVFLPALPAQKDFHFENYNFTNGLSNNEVRSLLRDRRGFLWVGTASGLNRFDGYEFEVFRPESARGNTVGGENIGALAEDSLGCIWIGHNQGVDMYDPRRDSFVHYHFFLADSTEFTIARQGAIYVLPDNRILLSNGAPKMLLFDPGSGRVQQFKTPETDVATRPVQMRAIIGNGIFYITRKSASEVWLSTGYGVFSFNHTNYRFEHWPFRRNLPNFAPGPILFDEKRDLLWFTVFGQGVYAFSYKRGDGKIWPMAGTNSYVVGYDCLIPKSDAELWTTGPGFLNMETGLFQALQHVPDDPYSIPASSVLVIYRDHEGTLWFGTTAGLSKLDPNLQAFKHVFLPEHPVYEYDNSVFEIYEEPANKHLYITSFYTGDLYDYDPATGKTQAIRSSPGRYLEGTTRIFRDSRGVTWLLTNRLIYQVDLPSHRFKAMEMPVSPSGKIGGAITDIEEDALGNLWFTKYGAGVLLYEPDKDALRYITCEQDGFCPIRPFFLTAGDQGRSIWIGTTGEGLFRYDVPSRQVEVYESFVSGKNRFFVADVTGLQVDQDNFLWITSRRGLGRLSPKDMSIRIFTYLDGLASTSMEGVGMDRRGRIWLANNNGLSSIDPRTLAIRNFDERHGLKIDAILDNFSVSPSGEIFSGTKRGFVRFHPDSIQPNPHPPQLHLTAFRVNGVERSRPDLAVDFALGISLRHDENNFTLEYTGINFTLSGENRYRYILEGFDPDWTDAGKKRQAAYTNVPPGRYLFRLKACNSDGVWTGAEKTLKIVIHPPYWRSWWFVMTLGLVLGGLVYSAYWYRIRQVRKEEQMKNEFNQKLAEVEMAALRSQMNPHFLFNCLNSINRFIQRNEPDAASAYLTKFSRLIRLVLDNSRNNLVPLSQELEALKLYLELESMRFTERFNYHIELSPELDTDGVDVPPMLVQPYVENAIWHGLMHKEDNEGRLLVKIYPFNSQLRIEVEDNGIGRHAAQELKSKSATSHKSHGMKVSSERIELINQIYASRAEVEVLDLKNPDGSAAGTRVVLTLPME